MARLVVFSPARASHKLGMSSMMFYRVRNCLRYLYTVRNVSARELRLWRQPRQTKKSNKISRYSRPHETGSEHSKVRVTDLALAPTHL